MKNRILGVTGVTGVGKDHLINAANDNGRLKALNLGTLIGEKLSMDRDHMMAKAGPDQIYAAQIAAYREVVEAQPAIVTCHAIRDQGEGLQYFSEMERIFNPLAYVFVNAPGALIAERVRKRNLSSERQSVELPAGEIEDEQSAKLELMRKLTGELGCGLVIIENVDASYDSNVELIRQEMEKIYVTPEEA